MAKQLSGAIARHATVCSVCDAVPPPEPTQLTFPSRLKVMVCDDQTPNRTILKRMSKLLFPKCKITEEVRCDDAFLTIALSNASEDPKDRDYAVLFFDETYGDGCVNGSVVIARILDELKFKRRPLIISCTGNADNQEEVARLRGVGADLVWGKPMPEEEEAREQVHQAIESLKWEY